LAADSDALCRREPPFSEPDCSGGTDRDGSARASLPNSKSLYEVVRNSMLNADAPRHTDCACWGQQGVHSRRPLTDWRRSSEASVDEALGAAQSRGHMDVMADLAFPLPATVDRRDAGNTAEDRNRFKRLVRRDDRRGRQSAVEPVARYLRRSNDRDGGVARLLPRNHRPAARRTARRPAQCSREGSARRGPAGEKNC